MFKRSLIILAASGLLVGVSAPAFAGNSIGFDPSYVLNANGKSVKQTHESAASALGFDPWEVTGNYQRPMKMAPAGTRSDPSWQNLQPGYAYGDPAFGPQADG